MAKAPKAPIVDRDLIRELTKLLEETGLTEIEIEQDGQRVMQQSEITIRVKLARGDAQATLWTCDLSHDYVSINADYRS